MYLFHHIKHLFMEEMVQEPNAGLTGVLLEGDGVAVDDFDILIIDIPLMTHCVPLSLIHI